MDGRQILKQVAELQERNTPSIRALRREISKELESSDRGSVMAIALDLVASGDPNARWAAYELVQHHEGARDGLSSGEVEQLGNGMASWVAVDSFGCFISGPAWREGRLGDGDVQRWARSDDRWWRRAALVSTVPLNVRAQGGTGDAVRTLAVCEKLVGDRDPMVVKALSWALRALAVRDREAVSSFVRQHEDGLAALVKREVRKKLETGLKTGRRQARGGAASR